MPNWCENVVTFTHDDPEMIKRVVQGYNSGKLFEEFIPCPPDLLREVDFKDENYREKKEILEADNRSKYGFNSWYDWSVAHWGTKWDVNTLDDKIDVDPNNPNSINLAFDTAWSPPIEFYERVTNNFKFDIHATYFEPGVCIVGEYDSEFGDDYYEFDRDSLDNIPQHLREDYNIDSLFEDDEEEYDDEDGVAPKDAINHIMNMLDKIDRS